MQKKQIPKLAANKRIDDAVGISFTNKQKPFRTHCKITARLGDVTGELRNNYNWNGADIPRLCWTILGIAPTDQRAILASGFHDEGCENPNTPQVVADAMFVALLGEVMFNGVLLPGVPKWRRLACYIGVRFWSVFCRESTRVFFQKES